MKAVGSAWGKMHTTVSTGSHTLNINFIKCHDTIELHQLDSYVGKTMSVLNINMLLHN